MTIAGVIALLLLAMLAYVRLAPSDPTIWHRMPDFAEGRDGNNSASRRVTLGPGALKKFNAEALSDPRTHVLAGSVEDGMVTYISRTRTVGFPDYTTARQDGDDLLVFGRSRFGRRDLGVNAARVDRWIEALTAY